MRSVQWPTEGGESADDTKFRNKVTINKSGAMNPKGFMPVQADSAAVAELKAKEDVANRKVESLQMALAALKDDHEHLKGAESSLRNARANLKDREEKLRAMSKQLEAARCVAANFYCVCCMPLKCLIVGCVASVGIGI